MSKKYNISKVCRLRMGIDGDGIRELILTAGCPLRCRYCINPFTWNGSEEIEQLTAREIYERVKIDRPYILATNGGITLGGGEPLLQPALIKDLRNICEPEMTIYVETSLNVPWENVSSSLKYIDRFYIDIKTMDEDLYEKYTSMKNHRVIDNMKKLIAQKGGDKLVVRVPRIPQLISAEIQEISKRELQKIGIYKFDLFEYIIP